MTTPATVPRAVIIDDDAQRAVRLRHSPALAPLSPVAVTWGPQVAPLLQFLEPEVVVATTSDTSRGAPQLELLRNWSSTRSLVVCGPVAFPADRAQFSSAGALAVASEDERARRIARTLVHSLTPASSPANGTSPDSATPGPAGSTAILHLGDAVIDLARGEVIRNNERITLGPRERALLVALARRSGAVVTRTALVAEVWRDRHPGSRVVDRQVYALRRRIERDPRQPKHVLTVFSRGYRLVV